MAETFFGWVAQFWLAILSFLCVVCAFTLLDAGNERNRGWAAYIAGTTLMALSALFIIAALFVGRAF
jgi:hypothetical protein